MKVPLNNLAFLKSCVTFWEANIHFHFTGGRKESEESCPILYQGAIMKIKIKIYRPLGHTFCSGPHHSYLLASVHICITGKAYKFVTVYFKQQRKYANQLASMFQHNTVFPLINIDASLFLNLPSLRIFLCKVPLLTDVSVGHLSCSRLLL